MGAKKVPPVKAEDPEKWKEVNTFECEFGRVSPEECERLRKRMSFEEWVNEGSPIGVLIKPEVCERCRKWKELAEKTYEKRKNYLKEVTAMEEKQGKYPEELKERAKELYLQGKKIKEIARELGIAQSTVSTWKKEGKWDEIVQEEVEESKDLMVLVDFKEYPELFEVVAKKAKEEVRSVGMQILWIIKKFVEMGECSLK